jgi:light-regulated signal transduction histidine kinase (bacteriophytochrome)
VSEGQPPAGDTAAHAVPAQLIHDLRTPLSQIIGYSEMLVEHADEAGDHAYGTDLRKVRAAGYRLLELINDHFRAAPQPAASATGATRLADFIVANREPILAEWEAFARTCAPASDAMDIAALRDHAGEMLAAIAADLRTWQSPYAQSEKSKGNAPEAGEDAPTAAEEHGAGRAESGFTLEQMVSEYRALRASVIRLWTKSRGELGPADLEDLTRFNEAIDQSLAESVSRYTEG